VAFRLLASPRHTSRVNTSAEEAFALLNTWKTEGVAVRAHFSGRRAPDQELQSTVTAINGSTVTLATASEEIKVDLSGADFNGDRRSPPNANHGAYLVCEFRNEDRWSFYAPRSGNAPGSSADRRSSH
jgi:hypothetical protein